MDNLKKYKRGVSEQLFEQIKSKSAQHAFSSVFVLLQNNTFSRELLTNDKTAIGDDGHTPLSIVEYDNDGNVIGGILGGTYWGWMYIDILWVDEKHRKQGIGTRLLHEAESEAVCRGCHHVHLDTMSWQAPEFYKKHGYEVIGILPDIPRGNQKYLLMKAL